MTTPFITSPPWSTASFPDAADTLPSELSSLRGHLRRCRDSRGAMFSIQCAVEEAHHFVAPRFVTLLVVVVLAFGVAAAVL